MLSPPTTEAEGRKIQRISLALPMKVEAKVDPKVTWSEVTRLSDVSAYGAGFNLRRPVRRGRLINLTMPLPRQLRCYDFLEPQYNVWGLVRRCIPVKGEKSGENYAHGVAFIGKTPPRSFVENPAKLFDLKEREQEGLWNIADAKLDDDERHLPADLRKHSRLIIPETIQLEIIDDHGNTINSETTITENLSLGGASVMTTLQASVGSFLRVISERYNITIISVVRGKRLGPDGISRLHIEFIDHFFPLESFE